MTDVAAPRRVLLVEDQDLAAKALTPILGEVDLYPELPTAPRNGDFKWIRHAKTAGEFIQQCGRGNGWAPDVILIDFQFQDDTERHSGLSVLHQAATHLPDAQLVLFSGQSASHGKNLFLAAAAHWFGVTHEVSKFDFGNQIPALFHPDASKHPQVSLHVKRHAHLIDGLFARPEFLTILTSWSQTGGQEYAIENHIHMSRANVGRYKGQLAKAAAAFEQEFTTADTPDLRNRGTLKEYLGRFIVQNEPFFLDPMLPEIVNQRRAAGLLGKKGKR